MSCSQHCACIYNETFDKKTAAKDLRAYIKNGPSKSTRKLIEFISKDLKEELGNTRLLDIGSGIGAIGLELSSMGLGSITCIDVSTEYLNTSKKEVQKRGLSNQFSFEEGDFTEISGSLPKSEVVTLDKSICCYINYQGLIRSSLEKSENIYGIVIPRSEWWVIAVNNIGNFFRNLTGNSFRSFVHPVMQIKKLIVESGFGEVYSETAREWLILVFKKEI